MRAPTWRLPCGGLLIVVVAHSAAAQEPAVSSARRLLEGGQALAALQLLEAAPQTRDALQWKARAHLVRAAQIPPAERCSHLRQALALASGASSGELVSYAHKAMLDDGCAISGTAQ